MKQAILILMSLLLTTNAEDCSYSTLCSDHTMCKYQGYGTNCGTPIYSGVTSDNDKQAVVDAHNDLRSQVAQGTEVKGNPGPQPSAANMREISWDDELATVAQRWADQCSFGHDSCRSVSRFYVGQNVYQTSTTGTGPNGQQDWKAAVQAWYNEVKDFDRNNIKPFQFTSSTGHYTQVVWANTYKVGCGFTAYQGSNGWYNKYYVCNYGPGGNVIGTSMYEEGDPCTQCPEGNSQCNNGLCE